jgi:hypothetical protein
MYYVLHDFIEKEHGNMLYKKGETYPKAGFQADPERVSLLQSNKNKYKKPFLGPELKATTVEETDETKDAAKKKKTSAKK